MVVRFLEFIKEDVNLTGKTDVDYEKNIKSLLEFVNKYVKNIKKSKNTEDLNLNLKIFMSGFKTINHKITYYMRPVDKQLVKRWYDYRERMYKYILNILNKLKIEKNIEPSSDDLKMFNLSFKKILNKKYLDLDF